MVAIIFQLLINGMIAGAIYSLVASGFSLIYCTNKFIHFAHGGVIMFTAYSLFWFFNDAKFNFYSSTMFAVLLSAYLGYLINGVFYKPLRKKEASGLILLLVSFAVLILLESLSLLLFGANSKSIGLEFKNEAISLFGATFTSLQAVIILFSLFLLVTLFFFLKLTKIGKAMRAVADNKNLAEVVGISSEKIYEISIVIGSAIAGIAAVLISIEQNITSVMGTELMMKGFSGAVIGGIGSIPGSILGSFFLGFAENFGIWFFPSEYKNAIAFFLVTFFLLIKPHGILGIKANT